MALLIKLASQATPHAMMAKFMLLLVFYSALSFLPVNAKGDEEQTALSSFLQWSSQYMPHVKEPITHYKEWKKNWYYVQEHNLMHSAGLLNYTLSMNQFALQVDSHLPLKSNPTIITDPLTSSDSIDKYPFDIDWRTKGVITPVQYDGCSQVLALVDAVNSANAIKTGHLVPYSAEEVSDCCYGCICDPGPQQADPPTVCIQRNGGLCRDIDYPWTTNMCMCHECNDGSVRQPIKDYHHIANGSEKDLTTAVKQQPVAVAIDSHDTSFKVSQ